MDASRAFGERLRSAYPWIASPLIVSAPMRLIAYEGLAVAVSSAQGIGFLAAGTDLSNFSSHLSSAAAAIRSSPVEGTPAGVLPIGVGFICWGADLAMAAEVIEGAPLKPCAAWLFAPRELGDLMLWADTIRRASDSKTKIWVQVGTVFMALAVARCCRPDVLVIQGADAGGHGLAQSSSVITLLPEVVDAMATGGFGHIPLIAAGGIMDGRGVAAAVTLGAGGVCLGTRFLTAPEAEISQGYRKAILNACDGGIGTARTTVYDHLRGTSGWPDVYNARGVLNLSFYDHERGLAKEENKRLYRQATQMGDAGWGPEGRMATYAGTGVGLVDKVMPAGDIVNELRKGCKLSLQRAWKL